MKAVPRPPLTSFVAAFLLTSLLACQPTGPSHLAAAANVNESPAEKSFRRLADATSNSYWEKRWWLEKISRRLRYGDGISASDDADRLMKRPEEEIIRAFMADPRFADSIFDFNSYFLGFKADAIKGDGAYASNAIEMSSALVSAQETMKNGDYLKILDLLGPVFVPPLGSARKDGSESSLTDRQARTKHAADLQAYLQNVLEQAERPEATGASICTAVANYKAEYNKIVSDGYPLKLFFQGLLLNPDRAQRLQLACDGSAPPDKNELITTLKTMIETNADFFNEMSNFEADAGYKVTTLMDFRELNLTAASLGNRWLSLGFDQASALSNSSTNMDRRRSAYILKQFFCDDLTPVGFETPEIHTEGKHGSDTSCFACHYKLDPMAGFFRNYGNLWGDFGRSPRLIFDDGATADLANYEAAWHAPPASGRKWDVGYVRSTGKSDVNSYGETLDDLSKILRSSPEVKQCLVKRMFEYFVATDQSIDAGYLQNLTDQFTKEAATNSSAAVKNTIVRLLTDKAAHTRNMDSQVCYDSAPGSATSDAPPCRVAFLLTKNCVSCHDGADASAHLDLQHWIADAPGGATFPHRDANGKQIVAATTFRELEDRLSSSDPKLRMPYKKIMSDEDRHELFTWVQAGLAASSDGAK